MKKMKTEIFSLAFGGEGVGRVDGKVCFVEGALPGEEVIFQISKETPGFIKGQLVEILKRSPKRVKPQCRYYEVCGGCQLQHISYEEEVFYKEKQVNDLISRIAGIKDFKCEGIIPSPDSYHYRSSVTLHADKNETGFFKKNSKDIIGIEECSIACDAINGYLHSLTGSVNKEALTLKSDHSGHVWCSDKSGDRFFLDRYRGVDMFYSPKGFSQCNREIAVKIAETLEKWIGDPGENSVFFDVYCGVGFFSFLINNNFTHKIGIDSSRVSINCAKTTLKNNKSRNIKFFRGEVETDFISLYKRHKGGKNILFLDPPRAGIDKRFLKEITALDGIERLFYLSCDPAKFARDLKCITADTSWSLKRILAFDMFPQTKHIEVLSEITRY